MLCEKVLGNIKEDKYKNKDIDYVDIEWHETFKKIHKKTSSKGREVGIRLGNEILVKGLNQGDVLWCEGNDAVAVNIPQCEVISVKAENSVLVPKICYEIGNRHAALFKGNDENEFITPYNEPMLEMLNKIHKHSEGKCYGTIVEKRIEKLNFDNAISSTVNNHTH